MNYAIDYLGGAKYQSIILKEHPTGWGAGFFDDEFGDCKAVVKALVESGRCPMVRIQLVWSHSNHAYGDSDIPALTKKAKKWEDFKKNHPACEVQLSFFCEHKLKNPDKYGDIVAKNAPSCIVVNSPLSAGALSNKYNNEFHGAESKPRRSATPFNFSFDGTSAVDANATAYKQNYSGAAWFFWWVPQLNCHMKLEDSGRTARPVSFQIDSLIYLKNDKGQTSVPSDWILKSHADQHYATPELRAGKPVIIAPDVGSTISFKVPNGQTIATGKKGKRFSESRPGKPVRYIYRVEDDYGFHLSDKAIRISGSPIVEIWYSGKKRGTCNLAFRDGQYR